MSWSDRGLLSLRNFPKLSVPNIQFAFIGELE